MVTEKELKQAKRLVYALETRFKDSSYLGVEIDSPFTNTDRFDKDYTIVDCVFQNIYDEIFNLHEGIKYGNRADLFGLTFAEAKRHIKKLKTFVKNQAPKYYDEEKAKAQIAYLDSYTLNG